MLHELVEHARREVTLPEIDGDRCVYALFESANCRACVEVCPRHAWSLDDESLDIDTQACDGCGLCAPACPQGAISNNYQPERRRWKARSLAFSACEYADLPTTKGVIPCLHSLSLDDLLNLHRDGSRYLVVTSASCDSCTRGNVTRLEEKVEQANLMLSSRGLAPLKMRKVQEEKWLDMMASASQPEIGRDLNRRGFLRRAVGAGIEDGLKTAGLMDDAAEDGFRAVGTLLPHVSDQDVFPYVPVIDPLKCNGCDSCLRLCPQEALVIDEPDYDDVSYKINAQQCTGCNICSDVCDQDAVHVLLWQSQTQHQVDMEVKKCYSCGISIHIPGKQTSVDDDDDDEYECRICKQTTRYYDVYQHPD